MSQSKVFEWRLSALLAVAASGLVGPQMLAAEEPKPEEQIFVVVSNNEEESSEDDDKKTAARLWIGVVVKEIQGDLAAYLGNSDGVLVISVLEDSPAEQAGIEVGDILLSAGDKELAAPGDLLEIMRSLKADDDQPLALEFKLLRQGDKKKFMVKPSVRPAAVALKAIVADGGAAGGKAEAHSFSFSAEESPEDVKKLMQKLHDGGWEKELNIFRFGNPSIVWKSDEGTLATDDIEVRINKEIDGEKLDITLTRKKDQAAEITVKDGDTVTKYTEKDLEEMPDELRDLLRPLLGEKRGWTQALRLRAGDGAEEKHIEARVQIHVPDMKDTRLGELLSNRQLADKYRAMAEELSERSRQKAEGLAKAAAESAELAEKSIRGVVSMPKEMEELRELVEDLRREVKQLRAELESVQDKK